MHQGTRDTYNHSAGLLSRHYDAIGSRDGDIDLAFTLAGDPKNAKVLELGSGNGRDAQSILRHTPNYIGIDNSAEMVAIAQQKVPTVGFEVADAVTYKYAGPYDIIFAFAIIRHLSIPELTTVLKKAATNLKPGGILYISSVYSQSHHLASRNDNFGTREMYYYNPAIIQKYCPQTLKKVQEIYDTINGVDWFEIALRKD